MSNAKTQPEDIAASQGSNARRPYRKPEVHSTEAFERLALQSCGDLSETPGMCDEL